MKKEYKVAIVVFLILFSGIFCFVVGHKLGYQKGIGVGESEGRDKYIGTLLPAEIGRVYVGVVVGINVADERREDRKYYRLHGLGSTTGEKYVAGDGHVERIRMD